MASLLNIGRGLVNHKFLPYDYEVEYLESNGTQWIDTLVYANETSSIYIEFMWNGGGVEADLCGDYTTQGKYFAIIHWALGPSVAMAFGDKVPLDFTQGKYKFQKGVKTFASLKNGEARFGNIVHSFQYSGHFRTQNTLTLLYAKTIDWNSRFYGRIYCCKYTDSTVEMDLIPVRIGTTGYLYDKVSGQLFGNSGTGSFILGPDK